MLQRSLLMSRSGASSLWSGYCDQLRRKPLLTKAATGVLGSIIGDGLAQYTASRGARRPGAGFEYDGARMTRLCAYSALIGTPIGHYWFAFLDKCIFPGAPTAPGTVLLKTLLDQGLMAPLGIAVFFVAMSLMEGRTPRDAAAAAAAKFRPTLLANYALWPAANLVNFAFVPPPQRILYCNAIYVFWASYLSAMASSKGAPPPAAFDLDLAQKELAQEKAKKPPAAAGATAKPASKVTPKQVTGLYNCGGAQQLTGSGGKNLCCPLCWCLGSQNSAFASAAIQRYCTTKCSQCVADAQKCASPTAELPASCKQGLQFSPAVSAVVNSCVAQYLNDPSSLSLVKGC
ncbi:SYM1 [Scenedesmus sp. PABB004]|nr:SYM1 [Scenedesmus sp. PABB004]